MTLTTEQQALRLNGIGSSEIAAVVGLNPYRGPHDIYNEKRGIAAPFEGNEATEFGNRLESVILDWYEEQTGQKLDRTNVSRAHPDAPWMLATVDALAADRIVEAKTASWTQVDRWGETGTDQVPDEYLVQVAWQMAVLDVDRADIAVLLDRSFRIYTVHRNMDLERQLIAKGRAFWHDNVLAGEPPEVDGSEGCRSRLGLYHDSKAKDYDEGDPERDEISRKLAEVREKVSQLEEERATLSNMLAAKTPSDRKGYRSEWGTFYWVHRAPICKTGWEEIARAKGVTQEEIDAASRFVTVEPYMTFRAKKK